MGTGEGARLYLVRHARTGLNAAGRLRGHLDPPLDSTGRQEAAELAAALAPLLAPAWPASPATGPVLVSSPLRRAVETATAIAERVGVAVSVEAGVIDRDYGDWAGCLETEVVARFGEVGAAPGVEPVTAVVRRARAVLDAHRDALARGPVVVVSHDAVNRALLADLAPHLGTPSHLRQRTACWNVLSAGEGGWQVERVDQKAGDT